MLERDRMVGRRKEISTLRRAGFTKEGIVDGCPTEVCE